MSDQDLDIYPGQTELTGSFSFDVGHPEWSAPIELFDEPLPVEQIAVTFDQLGRPMVFYRVSGNVLKLWWFDSLVSQTTTTILGYGTDPVATFDFPIDINKAFTDVLLHYVRKNKLYMRVQRDRFSQEYAVHPDQAETIIYLPFTDDFTDLTGEPWTAFGNVSIVSDGFFGKGGKFTGGYLQSSVSPDWAFGTDDFSIGLRIRPEWTFDANTDLKFICGNWSSTFGNTGWALYGRSDGAVSFKMGATAITSNPGVLQNNTWDMIEVARAGTSVYLFVKGALVATATGVNVDLTTTRAIQIGQDYDGGGGVLFTADSLFAIKGLAQRTTAYSVPSNPQPLWVNSATEAFNGLVFAFDPTTDLTPWVTEASWSNVGHLNIRYLEQTNNTYLATTYATGLVGLESNIDAERLKLNTAEFTIRAKYLKPNIDTVGYNDEVLYSYLDSSQLNGIEIGLIDKVYPYLRRWQSGSVFTHVSPTAAPINQDNSIAFVKLANELKIVINGTVALTVPLTDFYIDGKTASIGYRKYARAYDISQNPLAGHSRFLGFISAIEIFSGQAVLANRNFLTHPAARSTSQSNDGLRILSAGARSDYKFQLVYRRLNILANLAKLRYPTKGLEHYTLDGTYLKVSPGNFKVSLLVEKFQHWDITGKPVVLFGDLSSLSPANQISYMTRNGQSVNVRLPSTFSIALVVGFTSSGSNAAGSQVITKPVNQTLVISIGNTIEFIDLSQPFLPGLWEFTFTNGICEVLKDGAVVGSSATVFPTVSNSTAYGLFFTKDYDVGTIKAVNRFICSEVLLEGDVNDPIAHPSKGTYEKYSITNFGENTAQSDNGTRLTIVSGDTHQWL